MEDLEQKIQSVLNDPAQMEQIMSMVKSLGLDQSPQEVQNMQPLCPDQRQETLLNAIKPFVKADRREKIDKLIKISQFTKLAGLTLKKEGRI